ncbi:hypothetical protein M409DRAFT_28092 [Zasmidium cellare ATCC 36951]|uniref:Uncharacterized protein n=1 Tax=Zasmidium cellare ATCC 36951 TaxID=1080233 RepID=A0A6A6C2K4_ZASCE|nr:uncharacterized protein M409DRAFT_28092 [Zasmidium cellare ATCC 36951]KAF2161357.1 hypothetical protein M409DRAFT_28092 [Zasmidium cellare ATCC 36951]
MAWRSYSTPLIPFCPPLAAQPVCNPMLFRTYPDWRQSFYHGGRHGGGWSSDKSITALHDQKLEQLGDLGWSLDYATAWCYRHLVGRQPEVSDAIDTIRELCDVVTPDTPFEIFDHLDTALFGSKLRTMVYLRWKPHASCSTGTTSGPNVAGAPRITIELNSTAFDGFDADIDDLLEALIHQMIHAFFLVCCGVQKTGDKQDGRLMDGVHFGVILLTIKDICKQCVDGPLRLVFHASKRKALEGPIPSMDSVWPYAWDTMRGGDSAALQPYILTSGVGPGPADSQTHCLHDNRHVTFREIQSWQVQVYARALDADMESKGEKVWDFDEKHKLVEHDRRFITKPSSTYIELIWDEKRVMANREKALAFKSQKDTIEKGSKYELTIPDCEETIFKCVYDFINRKAYAREEGEEEMARSRNLGRRQLAPALAGYLRPHVRSATIDKPSITLHIRVFKTAQKLKFDELQRYAVLRLYELETTDDEPIEPLRMIYLSSSGESEGPIDSDLQKWSRRFLYRTDEHKLEYYPLGSSWCNNGVGISNLVKIIQLHNDGFQDLYSKSRSFREDVKAAVTKILSGQSSEGMWDSSLTPLRGMSSLSTDSLISSPMLGGRLAGGMGLGARPLLPSPLSNRVTERVTDTIDDQNALLPGVGMGMGMGMGLNNIGRGNGLLGLPPLRRASADILGGDLLGVPRMAPIFDHLPAL